VTTPILMPQLSPTMEVGKLAKWHVKEGDEVHPGDVVAEIETDKAIMEVEAVDEGTVSKLLVPEGAENVPVNQPIALLADGEGADAGASSSETRPAAAPQDEGQSTKLHPHPEQSASAPVSKGEARDHDGSAEHVMNQIAEQIRANGANGHAENGHAKRIFASPLARGLAREKGIDIAALRGSGPHGRIIKADVERASAAAHAAPKPSKPEVIEEAIPAAQQALVKAPRPAEIRGMPDKQILALYEPGTYELIPHDTMRRFIAERLTLSKRTIPHFYLNIDCQLDALLAARERMNGMAPHDGPHAFRLSINDFIIKTMAIALQTVPAANATWTEAGLLRHRDSDIAVAVALEGGGLHTPVIRNAEMKSLSEISNEMRDLAARARSKRLAPHEYQGGSTTISNLGMYGIDRFDAVINPPQASILAVGRAEKKPIIKDDAVKIATMMSVTLSVDHRVIDGALGAELLAAFKAYIEDPVTMLV
jgi:pyruvate dehydrogenase E2 component (dihydrolipoyllysine-residue acetyltransferase)